MNVTVGYTVSTPRHLNCTEFFEMLNVPLTLITMIIRKKSMYTTAIAKDTSFSDVDMGLVSLRPDPSIRNGMSLDE